MKNKTKNIQPLGDRVLIEPINWGDLNIKSESGIIIPDTVDKEKPEQGKVVAVGPGRINEKGELIPVFVKKGQIVLFSKYGPDEISVDGNDYFIISESNILAIIE